jgi:excisionase family DNA binding protein
MKESCLSKDMVTWFNTSEAAEYLSISKGVLLNMVSRGEIPYYKLGRRSNRYRKEELDELLVSTRKYSDEFKN